MLNFILNLLQKDNEMVYAISSVRKTRKRKLFWRQNPLISQHYYLYVGIWSTRIRVYD